MCLVPPKNRAPIRSISWTDKTSLPSTTLLESNRHPNRLGNLRRASPKDQSILRRFSTGTTTVTASTRPSTNVGQYNRGPLNTGTRPVGSPATAIPRGPLSAEERQRRRDNNLCLYCGNGGHLAQNCPNAPPARSIPRGDSTSVQVKVEDGPRPSPSAGNAKAPST